MRLKSLSIVAIALLGTASLGGCTYSKSIPSSLTNSSNQISTSGSSTGTSTGASTGTSTGTSTGDSSNPGGTSTAGGSTTPGSTDVCQAENVSAAVLGSDWSQQVSSDFGRPVNAQCTSSCSADSTHTPWDLQVHLSGSFYTQEKDYTFSFIKDAYKSKVIAFRIPRDPSDSNSPDNSKTGCWETCDGQCLDSNTVVKDSATLKNDASTVLANYLNDTCKLGITAADVTGTWSNFKAKLKTAVDASSASDFLQCAEGVLLTASQAVPVIDSALKIGVIQDDTGVAYTPDQIYGFMKKQVFDKALAP